MRFLALCKRHYTNRDLLKDCFGRLYHLPVQLGAQGWSGDVIALDYRSFSRATLEVGSVHFVSKPYYRVNLPWVLASVRREALLRPPHVVLASGDINLGAYGLWLSRRLKVPFVYDVYDQYLAYRSNRFVGAERLLRSVVRASDHVLTVSPALHTWIARDNPHVTVIDNGVDATMFAPQDKQRAREQLGLRSECTYVGYFGSIERRLGGDVLIAAVDKLRRVTGRDVQLLLAGKNAESLPLDAPFIQYRGLVPQQEVASLIAACDVVTMPYVRHAQNDFSGACKIAEYLCAERPVAATDVGRARDMLPNLPLAEPASVDSLVNVMRRQLDAPRLAPMPADLRWESLGARVHEVLIDAVAKGLAT